VTGCAIVDRMFAVTRCGRCQAGISANELVMRARDSVYHLHCFSCTSCGVPLSKGDHFGMRDGLVYCRPHYELLDLCDGGDPMEMMFRGGESPPGYYANAPPQHHKGRPRKRKLPVEERPPCAELPVTMRMAAATLGE
jgi:LIM homeobox protein 2/9